LQSLPMKIIGFGSDTLYGGTGPDTLEITGGPSGSHAYLQSGSVAGGRADRGDGHVGAGDHGADRGHGDADGGHGRPDRGGGNDLISHSIAGDHDTLQGGAGADTLMAGTGDNILEAGTGAGQYLVGGNDTAGTHRTFGAGAAKRSTPRSGVDRASTVIAWMARDEKCVPQVHAEFFATWDGSPRRRRRRRLRWRLRSRQPGCGGHRSHCWVARRVAAAPRLVVPKDAVESYFHFP
jgi:RTX calcium-binding nonapeptide repeat (4 copies)